MPVASGSVVSSGDMALSVSMTRDVEAHRDAIVALWREAGFGATGKEAQSRFDWFYLRSPAPKLHLLQPLGSSALIGCVGIGPREWWGDGERLDAGVLVDFLVAPGHRTLLPAISLQRQAHAAWLERNNILYALPNEKAAPIFKRFNTPIKLELVEYVRLVRPRSFLSKLLPDGIANAVSRIVAAASRIALALALWRCDMSASCESEFGEEFTEFWQQLEKGGLSIGTRDADYLSWRFSRQPGRNYRTLVLRDAVSNAMRGYFVCEVAGNMLTVRDFLIDGSPPRQTRAFRRLAQAALACGVESVRVAVTGSPALVASLRRALFIPRGGRPVFCYVSPDSKVDLERLSWFFTPADEDV